MARKISKQELHELATGGAAQLVELKGEGLHWVSEEGTLDNNFFTENPHVKLEFIGEEVVKGAKAEAAEKKTLR